MILLVLISSLLSLIDAQAITDKCGLPADPKCLVRSAQYTVVGNIRGTNLNQPGSLATPNNYNATMNIRCILASFSSPISAGDQLVGKDILVTNWGFPKPGCPTGTGAQALVGQDQIYFIYVSRSIVGPPASSVFSVQPICVGGIGLDNIQAVGDVVAKSPANGISLENRGSDLFCTLPGSNETGTSSADGPDPTFNSSCNGKITAAAFAVFAIATIALTL